MRWRDYGTQVTERTVHEPTKDLPLPQTFPTRPDTVDSPPGTKWQLYKDKAVPDSLNYLWNMEWIRRGRGRSWLAAWRAVGAEEADNDKDSKRKKEGPQSTGEVIQAAEGKESSELLGLEPSNDMQPSIARIDENTEFYEASRETKLVSLVSGLVHNPANGILTIEKEVEIARDEANPAATDDLKAMHFIDGSTYLDVPSAKMVSEEDVRNVGAGVAAESTFTKYRRTFQGLLFPPWHPYTHINLDPDGEFIGPDITHDAEEQPETATSTEEQPSAVPEPQLQNDTIHILGLGAVGKYIAHALASLPHAPPVTLLMHRPLVMQHWHDEGAAIRLVKDGEVHVQSGFHIESAASFRREHPDQVFPRFGQNLEHTAEPPNTVIDTLIVTTDAWTAIPALHAIRDRLRQRSTICFVQNGLGFAEKVSTEIFPDPDRRPTYVLASMSHRLAATEQHFTLIEQASGNFTCTKLPQRIASKMGAIALSRHDFSWSPQATHLVGSLLRASELNTRTLGHKSFIKAQLQKVVFGCIIGPLSVIYDCSNDQLLYNYNATLTMKALLNEISEVICSLPELQALDGIYENFNSRKLEASCVSAIAKTGRTTSTMLQAVRAGRRTDIGFFNGYILRRAAQLGIQCPRNDMVMSMVRGKAAMKSRELNGYIPMIGSG